MMTPFETVTDGSPESHYNRLHKCVRSTIERTFGILKGILKIKLLVSL